MFGYIYKTTNTVNDKIYIGKKHSTTFLGNKYLGSGIRLSQAVNKYGRDAFHVEMLQEASSLKELNELEKYYIEKYKSQNSDIGYNISPGGDGGSVWGDASNHPSLGKPRSTTIKGYVGYTDGDKVIYVKPGDPIPEGFYKGSSNKPNAGRITIYSNESKEIRKSVKPEEVEQYIRNGWITSKNLQSILARKKKEAKNQERKLKHELWLQNQEKLKQARASEPRVAWNKGLTKETDSRVRKMSESKMGHHSNTGWHHSYDARMRISEKKKGQRHSKESLENIKQGIYNMSSEIKKQRSKKLSVANSNLCWMTNGIEVIRVHIDKQEEYLKQGYIRGRKYKLIK